MFLFYLLIFLLEQHKKDIKIKIKMQIGKCSNIQIEYWYYLDTPTSERIFWSLFRFSAMTYSDNLTALIK